MAPHAKLFLVAYTKHIAPEQRRVERVSPGYALREFQNDSQGSYRYVVTALEVRTGGGTVRVLRKTEN